MKSPQKMQRFVMNGVESDKLQEVEDSLKDGHCINIKHESEGGELFTVTALCPMRDDVQNSTIID